MSSNKSMADYGYRVLCVMLLTAVLLYGCGKKEPPVAPSRAPLIGINDLKGELNKGLVRLTWIHPAENDRAAGYIVLRAQSALSKPDCPDCPQLYQRVGKIPVSRSNRNKRHPMEFYHEVAQGFKYVFNVRPYASSAAQGPDSNVVTLTRPKE